MRWLARLRAISRGLFHRRRLEADLEAELRGHLDQEIENNLRAGMTLEEATVAARRLVGPVALYKEECRDARGAGFFETLARDLRYAWRTLRRTPLFAVAAISTLALGIGANTTIFTFVENLLLRRLPVADPGQLVALNWGGNANFSYPNYVDFRDRNSTFSSLVADRYQDVSISLRARDNVRVWGYEATGNYFEALGIRPLMGRFFGRADDDKPGAHPVLVVSYRFWRGRLAADPKVIGRAVKVNGYPFTIIGVAPASFTGTELVVAADYWLPLSMVLQAEPGNNFLQYRSSQNLWLLGRLKPGVSRRRAEANLDQIGEQLARSYPDDVSKQRFQLSQPGLLGNMLRKPIAGFGVVLMAIAAAALLLACVNLAGMLLARAADRRREVAIRLALGASRPQLLRQWMTESLLLAAAGGSLGFLLAFGACRLFNSWKPDFDIPFLMELHPNGLVLGFAALISLLTTLLFGLAPSLQAIRTDVIPSLKNEPAWKRLRRWNVRDVLVAGQIAISMMLVICSVLVVRSLQHALSLNLGFHPEHAVSVSLNLSSRGYDAQRSRRFDAELVAKASALPGIESAGITSVIPLSIAGNEGDFVSRTDRPVPPPSERHVGMIYNITPGYFQAAGTRLLRGRNIDDRDRTGAPAVVVVNDALARLLFPNENPLGRHIRMSTSAQDPGVEIVGVVETGKYESIGEDPKPAVFRPVAQTGTGWTTLVVRTPLPPAAVVEMLRKNVLDLDPDLTIFGAGSLQDKLALPLFPARAAAIVLGVFGALAMVLAATGLFALMANAVARRGREMGIRMALGARPSQVLFAVLRRTVALCAAGISVGAVIALAGGHLLSAILYDVSPHDPVTYVTALVLMVSVALLACWHPASRAVRIDPSRALREE